MNKTNRSRGRPRQFDKEQLLAIAQQHFWQHGYEGTSVAELVAAMGITPPSLYSAFGSKENLYREVLDRYAAGFGSEMFAGLQQSDARIAIRQLLMDCARLLPQKDHPGGCMISTGMLGCHTDQQTLAADLTQRRSLAKEAIKMKLEQSDPPLPEGTDTEALGRFYAAMVQGMSVQARDGADQAQLEQLAELAMGSMPD